MSSMAAAVKAPLLSSRVVAARPADMGLVRMLFREYEKSVSASAGAAQCFIGFERELADLPGDCVPPGGGILLVRDQTGAALGVVAYHRLEPGVAEIKRLYLKAGNRGRRLGKQLMEAALRAAGEAGYRKVRLSTVPGVMRVADAMYQAMGFQEIPAYPGAACGSRCYETAL